MDLSIPTSAERPASPPRIAHDRLQRLHAYWAGLPVAGCGVPLRAAFDPIAVPYCLANLGVAEIETPFRVRYRLAGSALEDLYGGPLAGRYVDALYTPALRARVLEGYRRVTAGAAPVYDAPMRLLRSFGLGFLRLMLPLSEDGDAVDRVLVAIYPCDSRLRHAWQWRRRVDVLNWVSGEANPPVAWRDDDRQP